VRTRSAARTKARTPQREPRRATARGLTQPADWSVPGTTLDLCRFDRREPHPCLAMRARRGLAHACLNRKSIRRLKSGIGPVDDY